MIKKDTLKGFLAGLMVAILIPTTVFAASGKNIEVFYGTVKSIIIDGVDKTPTAQKDLPFIYNGTTYVPLRYFAESMDKPVNWHGTTGTIIVGEELEKPYKEVYLNNKTYIDYDFGTKGTYVNGPRYNNYGLDKFIGIENLSGGGKNDTQNENGLYSSLYHVTFSTNGQAKLFSGTLKSGSSFEDRVKGKFRIYNDSEELLYESGYIQQGMSEDIEVNVENSLNIKIEVEVISSDSYTTSSFYVDDAKLLTTDY